MNKAIITRVKSMTTMTIKSMITSTSNKVEIEIGKYTRQDKLSEVSTRESI